MRTTELKPITMTGVCVPFSLNVSALDADTSIVMLLCSSMKTIKKQSYEMQCFSPFEDNKERKHLDRHKWCQTNGHPLGSRFFLSLSVTVAFCVAPCVGGVQICP